MAPKGQNSQAKRPDLDETLERTLVTNEVIPFDAEAPRRKNLSGKRTERYRQVFCFALYLSVFCAISPSGSRKDGQACLHSHADIRRATDSERQKPRDERSGSRKDGQACLHSHVDIRRATDSERKKPRDERSGSRKDGQACLHSHADIRRATALNVRWTFA